MADYPIIGILLINNPGLFPVQFPDQETCEKFIVAVDGIGTVNGNIHTKVLNEQDVTVSAKFRRDNIIAIFYEEVEE